MIVKVKYDETVSREAMVEVDDEEFMLWANDGDAHSYTTPAEAIAAEPGLLKEFLEDGSVDWQQANDPSGMGYDQTITEAEL